MEITDSTEVVARENGQPDDGEGSIDRSRTPLRKVRFKLSKPALCKGRPKGERRTAVGTPNKKRRTPVTGRSASKRRRIEFTPEATELVTAECQLMKNHIDNMSAADLDAILQACRSVSCKWPRDYGTFLSEAEPQDNPPLALFRCMYRDHPDLYEEATTILSQRHPLPCGSVVECLDLYTVAATVIVFSLTAGVKATDAIATIRPIPTECLLSNVPDVKKPLHAMTVCDTTVHPVDFASLDTGHDLHDHVLHAYIGLVVRNVNAVTPGSVHVIPAYLPEMWDKGFPDEWLCTGVSMCSFRLVLMPVCAAKHWLLVAADVTARTVSILDSVANDTRQMKYFQVWTNFMERREMVVAEGLTGWTLVDIPHSQQRNPYDCGVHVIMVSCDSTNKCHTNVLPSYSCYAARHFYINVW